MQNDGLTSTATGSWLEVMTLDAERRVSDINYAAQLQAMNSRRSQSRDRARARRDQLPPDPTPSRRHHARLDRRRALGERRRARFRADGAPPNPFDQLTSFSQH